MEFLVLQFMPTTDTEILHFAIDDAEVRNLSESVSLE